MIYNWVIPLDDAALEAVRTLCLDEKGRFTFAKIPPAKGNWKDGPADFWTEEDDHVAAEFVRAFGGKCAFCYTIEDLTVDRSFRKRFAARCQGSCAWLWQYGKVGDGGKHALIKDGSLEVQYEWASAILKSIPVTMYVDSEEETLSFDLCVFAYKGNSSPVTKITGRWYYSDDWKNRDRNPLYMIGAFAGDYEAPITDLHKMKATLKSIIRYTEPEYDLRKTVDVWEEYYTEEARDKILAMLDELYEAQK